MLSQKQVFDILERRGVVELVVSYSGGNDDGAVDDVYLYGVSGVTIPHSLPRYAAVPTTEDELLTEALSEAVHRHSFAGEMKKDGIVTWNVADRSVMDECSVWAPIDSEYTDLTEYEEGEADV